MTDAALDALEPLLRQLRDLAGLLEVGRGIFCRKSEPTRAFLHFHEEPEGLFADLLIGRKTKSSASLSSFRHRAKVQGRMRLPVNDPGEQGEFFELLMQCLDEN